MLFASFEWPTFFFTLYSLVACVFSVAVLFTSNIVRMAFYLTISLGATAGLFFLAGAEFVGAMQLMIYVGGTLVLLIFGVMLTAQSRFVSMKTRGGDWVMAMVLGGGLLATLIGTAYSVPEWNSGNPNLAKVKVDHSKNATRIGAALAGVRVDKVEADEQIRRGMAGYLLPFVIISVHLLVVLIGAAYLARTKRRVASMTG